MVTLDSTTKNEIKPKGDMKLYYMENMESRFNANFALDQRLEHIVTSVLSKTERRNSSLTSNVKKAVNPINSVIKTTANTPTNELVEGPLINFLQKPKAHHSRYSSKIQKVSFPFNY